ncbi:glycosyltransferase family 9 protein [uncultured Jannaschia sp.]|uniref:glycosyltransferase family 9 protein n=1 Tax=uncultured Jannaschia sp. TaxID=293347 RepID=UPI00262E23E6|nr:glycosyltransferase family 9 protein [uncultured Jannaschia sp.]
MAQPAAATRAAAARLAALGFDGGGPRAILHPGAVASLATFAEVVRRLTRDHGWRILVTGGAGEGARVTPLAALPGAVAAGETNLPEFAALIVRAPVLVTMNTGPAHLAAALGTPVVDLYVLTNLQHAPWRGRGRGRFRDVPCHVCLQSVCSEGHHRCLAGIGAGAVGVAAREVPAGGARGVDEAGDLLAPAR